MRNYVNSGDEFRTKILKGKIPAGTYVTCIRKKDEYLFQDNLGNIEDYQLSELTGFAVNVRSQRMIDIQSDGDNEIYGYEHLTANVRSGLNGYKLFNNFLYCPNFGERTIGFKYSYQDLSKKEVIEILLNDVLYGVQPNLQSSSLVGTIDPFLDGEPNYHNGTYYLNNNKTYTMSWCKGIVKIQEGSGDYFGWYGKDVNNIYKKPFDYERYRNALIKYDALYQLEKKAKLFEEFPEILEIITNKLKSNPKYKLSYE